jgi:hypothetical protein
MLGLFLINPMVVIMVPISSLCVVSGFLAGAV